MEICIDCWTWVHNGTVEDPAHGWEAPEGLVIDVDPDDEGGFGRYQCDACGAVEGGYRFRAVIAYPGDPDPYLMLEDLA